MTASSTELDRDPAGDGGQHLTRGRGTHGPRSAREMRSAGKAVGGEGPGGGRGRGCRAGSQGRGHTAGRRGAQLRGPRMQGRAREEDEPRGVRVTAQRGAGVGGRVAPGLSRGSRAPWLYSQVLAGAVLPADTGKHRQGHRARPPPGALAVCHPRGQQDCKGSDRRRRLSGRRDGPGGGGCDTRRPAAWTLLAGRPACWPLAGPKGSAPFPGTPRSHVHLSRTGRWSPGRGGALAGGEAGHPARARAPLSHVTRVCGRRGRVAQVAGQLLPRLPLARLLRGMAGLSQGQGWTGHPGPGEVTEAGE